MGKEKELPSFDSVRLCQMCNTYWEETYPFPPREVKYQYHSSKDCMVVMCGTCGYTWHEKTAKDSQEYLNNRYKMQKLISEDIYDVLAGKVKEET